MNNYHPGTMTTSQSNTNIGPTPLQGGVREIAPGLYQAAWTDASTWTGGSVDVLVYMAGDAQVNPNIPQISFPIDDNAEGCDRFADVQTLAKSLASKQVLTVCQIGENRSGLLSALILVARGWDPISAVTTVQYHGPHHSATQPHSFWNPGFVRQVCGW